MTVPANGSRAHIVLSPVAVLRLRKLLEREQFDLLHLHEPDALSVRACRAPQRVLCGAKQTVIAEPCRRQIGSRIV